MAILVERYVDTGATGTATGLDWTNAYLKLSDAITAEKAIRANLVSRDELLKIHCRASTNVAETAAVLDTAAVTLLSTDFTTDATRYVEIHVEVVDRHNGQADTGYRLIANRNFGSTFDCSLPFTLVTGVSARNVATYTSGSPRAFHIRGNTKLRACFGRVDVVAGKIFNFQHLDSLENCIAVASSGGSNGYESDASGAAVQINNCTAVNCATGFYAVGAGSVLTLNNCVAYNCTTDYLVGTGTFGAGSTNNASSAATTVNIPGANPLAGVTAADFVGAASLNYTIPTTSILKNAGAVIAGIVAEDFRGTVRPQGPAWDIGFHEYEITGSVTTQSGSVTLTLTPQGTQGFASRSFTTPVMLHTQGALAGQPWASASGVRWFWQDAWRGAVTDYSDSASFSVAGALTGSLQGSSLANGQSGYLTLEVVTADPQADWPRMIYFLPVTVV